MCIYSLYVLIRAAINKRVGAQAFILGFIVLFITIINDLLYNNEIIDTGNFFSFGVLVFIFCQAYLISAIFSSAFKDKELLTEKLNFTNQNLEKLVEERTAEIFTQKEEILAQKEELQVINNELNFKNEQIQEQNEHIKASIRYAKTIQNAILPQKNQLDSLFENFIIYRPKDVVSGDFYWVSHLAENREKKLTEKTFFTVVDCTGHGVPGAFMSLIANRLLSEIINEKLIFSPKDILEELDKSIKKVLRQDNTYNRDGMDLSICKIEKDLDNNRLLTFSGAKRPLYYYDSQKREFKIFEYTRRSIGGFSTIADKNFFDTKIKIVENDIIILSTDGFSDQNNFERKRFTSSRLIKILKENISKPLNEQKHILETNLNEWTLNTSQRDDITLAAIKIK